MLEEASYEFTGLAVGVELFFNCGVAHTLPRRQQHPSCEFIANLLAPVGDEAGLQTRCYS